MGDNMICLYANDGRANLYAHKKKEWQLPIGDNEDLHGKAWMWLTFLVYMKPIHF